MATKLTLLIAAVAVACLGVACAAPEAAAHHEKLNAYGYGGCDGRTLQYLRQQIQLCTRNVPSQQYFNPGWTCAVDVSSALRGGYSCSLEQAPALLGECLESYYLDGASSQACLQGAIDNGSCC
ncbi:uncharacterized protein LOC113212279 [Frankliniella occidentalis]|uniref:Uncharacterized protein LOC113212279 n=1 Tax=Frankliniella occidentalis TaxID=133901 RepID=A0A6J1T7R0_FRAOC|nr:uncharacterized protein LOC113212279 [Frankliniella occidentalis]